LFSDLSHKEIAFDLGFSSPSALNKFVRAKLKETQPTFKTNWRKFITHSLVYIHPSFPVDLSLHKQLTLFKQIENAVAKSCHGLIILILHQTN
jgi:hypothetical protein